MIQASPASSFICVFLEGAPCTGHGAGFMGCEDEPDTLPVLHTLSVQWGRQVYKECRQEDKSVDKGAGKKIPHRQRSAGQGTGAGIVNGN